VFGVTTNEFNLVCEVEAALSLDNVLELPHNVSILAV
jgi:hypothetical protein